MLQHLTGGYKSSAKVAGGTLVLSLPDAIQPVVWRMDLNTAKSSAIEVRGAEAGQYDVVLKTPKADAHVIASYEEKLKATRALIAITKAMRKYDAQGPIVVPNEKGENRSNRNLPVVVNTTKKPMTPLRWVFRIIKYLFALLLIAMFISIVFVGVQVYKGIKEGSLPGPVQQQSLSQSQSIERETKTGEVMSADDFLKRR